MPATTPGAAPRQLCSEGEWLEMTFAAPSTVSQTEVYWFDDTGRGGVRVPASWRLFYKDGETWKPVESTDQPGVSPGVSKDAWNKATFKPVTSSALRIEVTIQPGVSAGVQEWKVK